MSDQAPGEMTYPASGDEPETLDDFPADDRAAMVDGAGSGSLGESTPGPTSQGVLPRAACRTCRAPVFWATFLASGRRAPIDYEPAPDGNLVIVAEPRTPRDGPMIDVIRKAAATLFEDDDRPRYINHWATCTNPPERKKVR